MRIATYIAAFLIGSGLFISCSGGDSDNTTNNTQPNTNTSGDSSGDAGGTTTNPPGSFSLTFPNNNEVCQEGAAVADQPDNLIINFKWTSSTDADKYDLSVLEYESGTEWDNIQTSNTSADVLVEKGTLYEWQVKATNSDGEYTSSKWSFYSKGESIANYVPYPAYNITFTFDTTNDLLTLQWEASDEDGDTLTYDVAIYENDNEIYNQSNLTTNEVSNVPVYIGGIYYAVIAVKDGISTTTTTSQEFTYE